MAVNLVMNSESPWKNLKKNSILDGTFRPEYIVDKSEETLIYYIYYVFVGLFCCEHGRMSGRELHEQKQRFL